MPVSRVCQGMGESLPPTRVSLSWGIPLKSKSIAMSDRITIKSPIANTKTPP